MWPFPLSVWPFSLLFGKPGTHHLHATSPAYRRWLDQGSRYSPVDGVDPGGRIELRIEFLKWRLTVPSVIDRRAAIGH
jgi:hypothetical protein